MKASELHETVTHRLQRILQWTNENEDADLFEEIQLFIHYLNSCVHPED